MPSGTGNVAAGGALIVGLSDTICGARGSVLLDDFEDGDSFPSFGKPLPGLYWLSYNDGTPNATLVPSVPNGNLWPPSAPGAEGSSYAGCLSGQGFRGWGANVTLNLTPFGADPLSLCDLSGYTGVRFSARGTGNLALGIQTASSLSSEYGGTCDESRENCNFFPRAPVPLTDDWTEFKIPWSVIPPGDHPLKPSEALGILFEALAPTDFDFCIDNLELYSDPA
jgi:hypothetical protein